MHDARISEVARDLLEEIQRVLLNNPSEADLRRPVDRVLEEFCREANSAAPQVRSEMTLASGRADAVFNRFVIEYERPGTLTTRLSDYAVSRAVEQLKNYIRALARQTGQELHRIAGVVLDGHYIIFVRYADDGFTVESPQPVSQESLVRMLRWLSALASGVALTPDNLVRDFGIEQPHTQKILRALYRGLQQALSSNTPTREGKLFEQWRILFSEAIDYSVAFGEGKSGKLSKLKDWANRTGFNLRSANEVEQFFFVLHTYFALLVKLIARMAVMRAFMDKLAPLNYDRLASLPTEMLKRELREMESGDIFRKYGIQNLLEGDFFAWYLHAWNPDIEQALRELLQRLGEYDPTTLSLVPEETRDLFKKLYHYLLPREVRHNLGEYYTPDWLAEQLLSRIDDELFAVDAAPCEEQRLRNKVLTTRLLDPACGSGTFLVIILRRLQQLGRELLIPEADMLDSLTRNVVGFDINPLAVLTARVNYLLAIADLLPYRKGEIAIPVYLADSVQMPAFSESLLAGSVYEFPTAVGKFLIPTELCTAELFDKFCALLEECIRSETSPENFLKRVEQLAGALQSPEPLRDTYERMLQLHQQGLNEVWARVLKNNFAPLTVGQFDYIVGNPPWVNWEHLPDNYRKAIRKLWEQYKLPPQLDGARLGAVKGDLSALMTLVVADKLLNPAGKLGFVITQSLFKTAAGAGFRRFKLPDGTPLRVLQVDDMVDLNPFEGASNRTAVLVLQKGDETRYPVSYTVWRKQGGARFTYASTLSEVQAATTQQHWLAEPAQLHEPTSQWLTAPEDALSAIRKAMGNADYKAHLGVNTGGANAVYWLEKVGERPDGLWLMRNLTEGAKREVEQVTELLEPDLLYPLLRGRDVQRWRAQPSAWILVPQDPQQPNRAYPEARLQVEYPKTYAYLKQFESVLRQRSGYKQILSRREGEFYGLMDINTYTFAPWKVVWANIASSLDAAVVGTQGGKPVLPQHIVTLVECDSENEAHYLCALINSAPANVAAQVYSQTGGKSFGTPHILEHIRIPRYDARNEIHRRLAELSQQAHQADSIALPALEVEIDRLAAQLWELTEAELKAIHAALRALGSDKPTSQLNPPLWGIFAHEAEMMDELVKEVYERRATDEWRVTDEVEAAID